MAFGQSAPKETRSPHANDRLWLQSQGTLLFHDAFDREEIGHGAEGIGQGWNSATANRVPGVKMADLDEGILKVSSATKEAGHAAHIHHEAGFADGGVVMRFRFPGVSRDESLQVGFVDRQTPGIHAGHLAYALLSSKAITLMDWKTGVMDLKIRGRRQEFLDRKQPLPPDLEALLKSKQMTIQWNADQEWHELVIATEGDELRLSLDGVPMASHRSEGFAHPTKRWVSFLIPSTVWIDDVKVYRVR